MPTSRPFLFVNSALTSIALRIFSIAKDFKMSILNYFSSSKPPSEIVSEVEDITSTEKEEVTQQLITLEENNSKRRGKYRTWKVEEKIEIGNYAIKNGVAKTIRDLSRKYSGLSKQSVCDFKKVKHQNKVRA